MYTVSDARHPWMKAYLCIVDSPYVQVAVLDRHSMCRFDMAGVPPGKHTLDVWHPYLVPVKKTIEVEVKENQITEVLVELAPPG